MSVRFFLRTLLFCLEIDDFARRSKLFRNLYPDIIHTNESKSSGIVGRVVFYVSQVIPTNLITKTSTMLTFITVFSYFSFFQELRSSLLQPMLESQPRPPPVRDRPAGARLQPLSPHLPVSRPIRLRRKRKRRVESGNIRRIRGHVSDLGHAEVTLVQELWNGVLNRGI